MILSKVQQLLIVTIIAVVVATGGPALAETQLTCITGDSVNPCNVQSSISCDVGQATACLVSLDPEEWEIFCEGQLQYTVTCNPD
jgi:hypothetical protein